MSSLAAGIEFRIAEMRRLENAGRLRGTNTFNRKADRILGQTVFAAFQNALRTSLTVADFSLTWIYFR
jgi:hypothetical protein